MICCIPFCQKDVDLAVDLLKWIRQLGDCKKHSCLLVADPKTDWWKVKQCLEIASESFAGHSVVTSDNTEGNWKEGANALFLRAAQEIEEVHKQPWLWLEPDAVPLKSNWLDTLETVYNQAQTKFMGFIYDFAHPEPPVAPFKLMSGVAVYPGDSWSRLAKRIKSSPNLAFDVACAELMVAEGIHTNLIQHFYGEVGLPPTFVETQTSDTPRHAFGLDRIHKNAVVFHRCKDGSLMRLLSAKHLPEKVVVVFPFCNRDAQLLLKNLMWMKRLDTYPLDTAILAYDYSCRPETVIEVERLAKDVFGRVWKFSHAAPTNPQPPWAANHVFRCVTGYINSIVKRPFLWFEPDMVPIKKGWLIRLQTEYARCGKPFFGAVVPGMGHMNGTAIYPADTYARCPNIRNDTDAFDTMIRHNIGGQIYDASQLIQCAWVMDRGQLQPHGRGQLPSFNTVMDVKRMILPTAQVFHRDKQLTLIDRLIEMGVA